MTDEEEKKALINSTSIDTIRLDRNKWSLYVY